MSWLWEQEAVQHEGAAADATQLGPDRPSHPECPPQRPRSTAPPVVRIEGQLHRVAELCRSNDQGGACGAAGPASAPGSALGRPARRTPGHTLAVSADQDRSHGTYAGTAQGRLPRRAIVPLPARDRRLSRKMEQSSHYVALLTLKVRITWPQARSICPAPARVCAQ